jgi:hypothetical protein
MEYKMPYIIGIIFVVIVVSGLIMALKEQADAEKSLNIPYRVVKNGLGKYLLQRYKKIQHNYSTDDPRDLGYHYEWVTVDTYDDLQDAKIQYRIRLAEAKHEKEKEEQKKKSIEELKKQQEEENKIVEIIKMED